MDGRGLLAWLHGALGVAIAVLALLVMVGALFQEAWAGLVALVSHALAAPAVLVGLLRKRRGPYRAAALLHALATFLLVSEGALVPAILAAMLFAGSAFFASSTPSTRPPHP